MESVGTTPDEIDRLLGLGIAGAGSAPRDGSARNEWWHQVVSIAVEAVAARQAVAARMLDVPLRSTWLKGRIARVEVLQTSSGAEGRGAVWFEPERPGRYTQRDRNGEVIPERYTTDWLSNPEGRRVFAACSALVGRQVEIHKGICYKLDGRNQVGLDDKGAVATTSRVLDVREVGSATTGDDGNLETGGDQPSDDGDTGVAHVPVTPTDDLDVRSAEMSLPEFLATAANFSMREKVARAFLRSRLPRGVPVEQASGVQISEALRALEQMRGAHS